MIIACLSNPTRSYCYKNDPYPYCICIISVIYAYEIIFNVKSEQECILVWLCEWCSIHISNYITSTLTDLIALSTSTLLRPFIHTYMCWYLILSVRVFYCFHVAIPKNIEYLWEDIQQKMNLKDHGAMYRFICLIGRFDNDLFRRQINHITPNVVRNRNLEMRISSVYLFVYTI